MEDVIMTEEDVDKESSFFIGSYCLVEKNNKWLKAQLLLKRAREGKTREFLVHFLSLDKRLDEWVLPDRIKPLPGGSSPEKKSTDNSSMRILVENQTFHSSAEGDSETDEAPDDTDVIESEFSEVTKVKYIDKIQFGVYEIDTWYYSPYPNEYCDVEKLFICEFCLKYMKLECTYRHHLAICDFKGPPGKKVYEKGCLTVTQVDPTDNLLYCQNLSLLGKLFIDHKAIFYDLDEFVFYVLCELESGESHLRGYFSREKVSMDRNNLSCISVLPPFQRRGFGKFLIGFSYELTKLEGSVGSPEKPLSDIGRLSYESYWSWVLLDILKYCQQPISLTSLSQKTGFLEEDILSVFKLLGLLKYWSDSKTVLLPSNVITSIASSGRIVPPPRIVDLLCIKKRVLRSNTYF